MKMKILLGTTHGKILVCNISKRSRVRWSTFWRRGETAPYEGKQLNISVVTKEATEALATVQKSLNATREEFKNFKWRL
ncbi:hypothetical protein E5676_scaffold2047G00210 [Cucumis melo var. makuwa]|uniref:Uncharacterized protein n=1 Tax=Cucumis melo var. makuwa TaxID=1194695 RepID=A0A5D3CXF3_CUCMM|nr:hypothetical protein E6C27_scaffold10081G00020 [Cucumis melo var. makuwa]TYK14889.1 hypothetical protein E5676_scaffold2047G00210 [Cucumis melo var. makuwa]